MPEPSGFEYSVRKNGDVVITHQRRLAAVLRGHQATRFLSQVETRDAQQLMARITGNYKRGNERLPTRRSDTSSD
ncbi:MAG TPA: hypothetical protein VMP13_04780 [Acidimicrobiia bacterium]|nr:hypothetical protein [Acidimicrobiia bacterium]